MPNLSPKHFDPFEPSRIVFRWLEAIHDYGNARTPVEAKAALDRLDSPDEITRLHELRSRFVQESRGAGVPAERALADYQRLEKVGERIRTNLRHGVYSVGPYGLRRRMNRELDALEGPPREPRNVETLRLYASDHNRPILDEVTNAYFNAANTLNVLADLIRAQTEATIGTIRPGAVPPSTNSLPENAASRRRGRPRKSDPVKDRELREAWKRARGARVSKEQFCDDWPTTPEELDAALKRERDRESRLRRK